MAPLALTGRAPSALYTRLTAPSFFAAFPAVSAVTTRTAVRVAVASPSLGLSLLASAPAIGVAPLSFSFYEKPSFACLSPVAPSRVSGAPTLDRFYTNFALPLAGGPSTAAPRILLAPLTGLPALSAAPQDTLAVNVARAKTPALYSP